MEEEYEILENTVKDFNAKYIENNALKIENEGISELLLKSLSEQGFLSMTYQVGAGKNLDMKAYSIILENLAKVSPSVAVKVLLTNAFLSIVNDDGVLNEVSQGSKSGTVVFSELLGGYNSKEKLKIENGRLTGKKEFILGANSNYIVTLVDNGELVLVKSGFKSVASHKKLGFRGLEFSTVSFDTGDFSIIGKDGIDILRKTYDEMAIPISAIALGISEGSIAKAIEYGKVRMAFNHYLKDFQPIAFNLTTNMAELSIIKQYFRDITSLNSAVKESLYLKIRAIEMAKEVSKNSLQTHGGYGYLEDFGVEKFYRDSMALSILFYNEEKEMEKLAEMIFESKAGFV
jgi:alkylation response protein AidB-like acyl-CoA dehydrogenase